MIEPKIALGINVQGLGRTFLTLTFSEPFFDLKIVTKDNDQFMSADQIQDQYEYAMKLHMGNKINDKNVFSLNLNLASCIFQRYQK